MDENNQRVKKTPKAIQYNTSKRLMAKKKKVFFLMILFCVLILAVLVVALWKWAKVIKEGDVVTERERLVAASTNHSAWIVDGKLQIAGEPYENQDVIQDWKYLVQVSISDHHIVALNHSGLVHATGVNGSLQCEINGLKDVRYIEAGMNCSVAVMEDGTVKVFGIMDPTWREALNEETGVSTVAIGNDHMAVLHDDGTVTAYGNNENGKCNVKQWKKIRQISVGNTFTVGLTSKGRIQFAGTDANNSNFSVGWEKIVDMEAGNSHVVSVDKDGVVRAVGLNTKGECEVIGWNQVVSVAAGYDHTIALTETGEIMAVGYNGNGQCDVY